MVFCFWLKLEQNNVLLDHSYNACLTDFGYASMVGGAPEASVYLQMTTIKPGTVRWAAPEHFVADAEETSQTTQHTTKSDIYSFGNLGLLASTVSCTACLFSSLSRCCLGSTHGQGSKMTSQSCFNYHRETSRKGLRPVQLKTNIGSSSSVVGHQSMTGLVLKMWCLLFNNFYARSHLLCLFLISFVFCPIPTFLSNPLLQYPYQFPQWIKI